MAATLHERMAEAWINRRHRVCGRALDDYCANHIQLLTVLRSPVLDASAGPIDWPSLLLAVEIGRTPYDGEIRFPSVRRHLRWVWPRIAAIVFRWHLIRFLRFGLPFARFNPLRFSAYTRLASRLLLQREVRRFRTWQNDFQAEPDLFFEQEGTELTAPALLARVIFVRRHLHVDERRAWTMPIGKLLWDYAATLEQVGTGVRMLEPKEADEMDLIRRIQQGEATMPPEWAAQIEEALRADRTAGAALPAVRREINLAVFGPA